jgi:hypothetical protein
MKALARAVLDAMSFLELSEPPVVDEDAAVAALEMLAAELQRCTPKEKSVLREVAAERAVDARGRAKKFYDSLAIDLGFGRQGQRTSGRRPREGGRRRKNTRGGSAAAADLKLLRHQVNFTPTSGDEAMVARLLGRSPALANAEFSDRSRPLHHAAMWGYDGIVTLLIARGADVNARDGTGKTPLHWAAVNGHKRACELLLAAGADVAALDAGGRTPLAAAEAFLSENAARVHAVLKKRRSVP